MTTHAMVPLIGVLTIMTACSNGDATPATDDRANLDVASIASDGVLPDGVYILPGRMMPVMLDQCSRGAPAIGQSTWQPNAADIAVLEAALPAALAEHGAAMANEGYATDVNFANVPTAWVRQYIGIMRGSTRTIYGNFVPAGNHTASQDLRNQPIILCDGGRSNFGVEFDTATRRFTHLDFNGES